MSVPLELCKDAALAAVFAPGPRFFFLGPSASRCLPFTLCGD
jgi:hypothetical protein